MTILVTGATGQLGSGVMQALLKAVPAQQLAVSVREPKKAEHMKEQGVDVRQGNFDDPTSLDRAFAGVDRLLLISTIADNDTRIRQHTTAVAAASRAGVRFLAYTSLTKADTSPLALGRVHRTTEQAIRETGIPFSFLRNNWHIENDIATIQAAAAGQPVLTAAGDGRVGWAARQDFGAAAAAVLAGAGHENTIYELSGPPRTYQQFAQTIGAVLGREVPVQQVDPTEYGRILAQAGLPDFVVALYVDVQRGIQQGALDLESGDFEALLGRPVTPLAGVVARIAEAPAQTG